MLNKKALKSAIGIIIAGAAIAVVWNVFDIGTRMKLSGAIDDILAARNVGKARESLHDLEDRSRVVGALKEAVEEDTASVQGKIDLIQTLVDWQEPRAARRALESDSVSSRRAASWRFHGKPEVRDIVVPIVIDWIKQSDADMRSRAAMIVNKLKIKECVPILQEALKIRPETNDSIAFARQALDALATFKPEGFAERAIAIAMDAKQHPMLRGKAFSIASQVDGAPTDRLQKLLLQVLADKDEATLLRDKAAGTLRHKKFGNAAVWAALETVLFAEGENFVLQRACLYSLGATAPLDRVKGLFLDRRVYNHPYFGIRVDVTTALAAMGIQEKIALEILCTYMEESDEKDLDLLVPQEAWLSFYQLTGVAYGVAEPRLFPAQPRAPIRDEGAIRDYMFRPANFRAGVPFTMVQAVRRMTTSNLDEVKKGTGRGRRVRKQRRLEDLKRIAATCRGKIDEALARIDEAKKAAEEKKAPDEQGPQLPGKDDQDKKEDPDKKKDDPGKKDGR